MNVRSLLWNAPMFDVHKHSENTEVINTVNAILEEIIALRKSRKKRIRDVGEVRKSLMVVVIDLWVAYKLSLNPYRGISKNKSDYQGETRYKKIFLKFDYLIPVINDLCNLGYVKQKLGYRFLNHGRRTRIRAKAKLINKILSPENCLSKIIELQGAISIVNTGERDETIIIKDENKKFIDYVDDDNTNQMRQNLKLINEKIKKTRISLDITDEQYRDLISRLSNDKDYRETIDFTRVALHRVFNNSSWENGGRFYGAWWQNIPKEYRMYIDINHKSTVEVDYSGHHVRMLYANAGIDPPDDPYDLDEFDRDIQKRAMLILINTQGATKAANAIRHNLKIPPSPILKALERRHQAISKHFYTGSGLRLMNEDSNIAEKVILMMMDRGATVLPVHDSFVVRNTYQNDLIKVMESVFTEFYGKSASLKVKTTSLDQYYKKNQINNGINSNFVNDDLSEFIQDRINNYKWNRNIWGL